MRVLVFSASYPPASRGGTVRAIEGLVARLGREIEFYVFARDRYADATVPLPGVKSGHWVRQDNASVFYADPSNLSPARMAAAVRLARADCYYLNSFLSPTFATLPAVLRAIGAIARRPVVLAPRGELSPHSLRFKRAKKLVFLRLARTVKLHQDTHWQASTAAEAADIRQWFPAARVSVAPDLTALEAPLASSAPPKTTGQIRVVYLSRITPLKNLACALRALRKVAGSVHLDVYGAIEDASYFSECTRIAATLPGSVSVRFRGELPHPLVMETLAGYHVFLLPTFGESFGHAILEALLAGAVPVITDTTPWGSLERTGAGLVVPLGDEDALARALQTCTDWDATQFAAARWAAQRLGRSAANRSIDIDANRELFRRASRAGTTKGTSVPPPR